MSLFIWYLVAFGVGVCVAIQPPSNAAVSSVIGVGPALIILNAIVLIGSLVAYAVWPETPKWSSWSDVPPLYWCGAFYGLFIVVGGMLVFPKIGATTSLGLILLGQFIFGALVDHFGWFGMPRSPMTMQRIAGLAVIGIGFVITQYKPSA